MTPTSAPKVFISHASEDKERFVLRFAELLRTNGVDAWLDRWEMLPGDSLVDKIFEQGIRHASIVIVVLSSKSVTKPWVREELNVGFVNRLQGNCRLIPVVLDDCEIPECLKAIFWQRIKNLNDYKAEFQQILNSIFGLSSKPPVGTAPAHSAMSTLLSLPALHRVDNLILEALCEESVRVNDNYITNLACLDTIANAGVADDEIRDALAILADECYIDLSRVMGTTYRNTGISHLRILTHTFDEFARVKWEDYNQILEQLVAGLVNEKWQTAVDIEKLDAPARLRDHLVRLLEDNDLIKVSRHFGGYSIWQVSPKLRRSISES